ncbi:MAG: tyrosine-type recombinase/integrase [Anaerolineales bacterium]|nr:tyrosine-type recombinase/integrase [Anaerolineales bacterium]
MTMNINATIEAYLETVALARSENTVRTYRNAMQAFRMMLTEQTLDPDTIPSIKADERWIADFAQYLRHYAASSESLYLTAANGWFEFLDAQNLANINLSKVRLLIKRRGRHPGRRLPQFPRNEIEKVISYAQTLDNVPSEDRRNRLRALRDRAFLILLADSGLRVHEACSLRRGQLDWNEARALVIGKGDKEAVVRLSVRSLEAIKRYLNERSRLDGAAGRMLSALPVFARHDLAAGSKVLPISTTTGRAIVKQRVKEAIDADAAERITPHSFRHYFVTTILRASGGNLKLAQELARHTNIAVTQLYAHLSDDELDRAYYEIFDQI